jgi:peroxiredoxin Q/BCP
MKEMETGKPIPEFCLPDQDGRKVCSKDFRGKWLVVYFYPKDNTPGCTIEAKEFSSRLEKFRNMNAEVVGISPDSGESHCNFIEKHNLRLTLLTDDRKDVLRKFGAWKPKRMFGREFLGVKRSTFLADPEGKLAYSWNGVNALGHADNVLEKLRELEK